MYPLVVVGVSPAGALLAHIGTIAQKKADEADKSTPISIGAGLPPVPKKLVERIQSGDFIDMAELLPDRLGTQGNTPSKDEKSKRPKRQVASITEWVQCFCIYMAVLTSKSPERIQDLLGYMAIIVEACREYEGDTWLGYDRRFRQRAAASPDSKWARIDPTLWNMAFTGQAKAERCKYCFSLSHKEVDCDWAPQTSSATAPLAAHKFPTPRWTPRLRNAPVCKSWNFTQQPSCDFRSCTYQHVCMQCSKDPQADKAHKLINCPKRQSRGQVTIGQQQPHLQQQPQQHQQPPQQQQQQFQRYQPY